MTQSRYPNLLLGALACQDSLPLFLLLRRAASSVGRAGPSTFGALGKPSRPPAHTQTIKHSVYLDKLYLFICDLDLEYLGKGWKHFWKRYNIHFSLQCEFINYFFWIVGAYLRLLSNGYWLSLSIPFVPICMGCRVFLKDFKFTGEYTYWAACPDTFFIPTQYKHTPTQLLFVWGNRNINLPS